MRESNLQEYSVTLQAYQWDLIADALKETHLYGSIYPTYIEDMTERHAK